jgi:transcription elongation factor Elf1
MVGKFKCPLCEAKATVIGRVLNLAGLAFEIEATCSHCHAFYYKRVEKYIPDGEAGDQFVKAAVAAIAEAIEQNGEEAR